MAASTARRRRAWVQGLLVAACVVALALLAAWGSWRLVVSLAGDRLAAQSTDLLSQAEAMDAEATRTLQEFDAQPARFCTPGELAALRYAVYATFYVKDILRLRGDRACTASAQALTAAAPPLDPATSLLLADGRRVASSMPLPLIGASAHAPVIAGRETRVALDPAAFRAARLGHAVAYHAGDRLLHLYGDAMPLEPADWQGGVRERDGLLLAPLCGRGAVCVATREAKAQLLAAQWPLVATSALLGGLAGGGIGVTLLLVRARRHSLEARLRRAIETGGLYVEYQPIVRIADAAVVGAEALVRWRDRRGRSIPPGRFIPLAEELGLTAGITRVVLAAVIRDFGNRLRDAAPFRVNINLSARELDDLRLHADIADELRRAGIACPRIGIEITEHSTAEREAAIAGTQRLSEAGHPVCIDDFGTGYSSLSTLAELRVDVLKIDRSFTVALDSEGVKRALVPQIVALARSLKLAVVVEGVETRAQADALQAIDGELLAQGWLYGRPVEHDAFARRWPPGATAAPDAG